VQRLAVVVLGAAVLLAVAGAAVAGEDRLGAVALVTGLLPAAGGATVAAVLRSR
jgi:hypothetical protein